MTSCNMENTESEKILLNQGNPVNIYYILMNS